MSALRLKYEAKRIAVFEDGSYIVSPLEWEIRVETQAATNLARMRKIARAQELGLSVPNEEPVYSPIEGLLQFRTLDEAKAFIEGIRATVRIRATHSVRVTEWGDGTDDRPGWNATYGAEEETVTFAPDPSAVPEAAWEDPRRVSVAVQAEGGEYRVSALVAGDTGSGTLVHPGQVTNAPQEIQAWVAETNRTWEASRTERRARDAEEERAELRKELGL